MQKFSLSTFAGASLGVLAFALGTPGSVSAQYGSSGGSSGGSSHGSLFKGHGSSGGSSHGSLFSHGSSGGSSHGSLFSHGSSGGSSHGSLFSHGSSGGSSHGSLFSHGSSGGSSHGSLFSHGSSGGSSHGSLFSHGSSGGSSHGSLFSHGSSGGSSHGSLFSHGSNGGSSHGSLFNGHGSNGGSSGGSAGGSYGSAGGYFMVSNAAAPTFGDSMLASTGRVAPVAPANTGVAYLNVNVPADAKVYLQDQLMTVGGTQCRFVTPQMENGVQHVYTVKVEVVRDGQTLSKTAQATVAAGQEIGVSVAFNARNQQDLVATTGL